MGKIKEIWSKLNPRAAVVGGVLVVTTSIGTCQFARVEPVEEVEEVEQIEPVEEVEPETVEAIEADPVEAIEAE